MLFAGGVRTEDSNACAAELNPQAQAGTITVARVYSQGDEQHAGEQAEVPVATQHVVPAGSKRGCPATLGQAMEDTRPGTTVEGHLGIPLQHQPRPRLVVPPTGTSSVSTATIHMRVWSVRFFDDVAEEVSSATGLCHLMWKGTWGAYQDPNTVVMASRKMRAWLLDEPAFAKHYLAMKTDQAKVRCLRDGMQNKTTLNGQKYASYLKQFKDFIKAPRDYAKEQDWNFADIMSWQTSFHILEPIKNEAYVRSLLGRLRYSGLPLN